MCFAGGELKDLILKGNKHLFDSSGRPSRHSAAAHVEEGKLKAED